MRHPYSAHPLPRPAAGVSVFDQQTRESEDGSALYLYGGSAHPQFAERSHGRHELPVRNVSRDRTKQMQIPTRKPTRASFEIPAVTEPLLERLRPLVLGLIVAIGPGGLEKRVAFGSLRIKQLHKRRGAHEVRFAVETFPNARLPLIAAHFGEARDQLVRAAVGLQPAENGVHSIFSRHGADSFRRQIGAGLVWPQ